jgi:lipopolysaccharide export LptBFGC system permease protein LptF
MSAPGSRLRSFARRVCNPRTMERLIDPLIADQQHEYAEAIRAGDTWRRRRVRLAGCIAFWKVVAMVLGRTLTQEIITADDRAIGRTIRVAGLATMLFTALFTWVPLREAVTTHHLGNDSLIRLMVYLLPQALAVAVPLGIVFGILSGGIRTRRSRGISVLLMFAASLTTLVLAGWLMPEANQAFRETMFALINGFDGQLTRGTNELTLGQLLSTDAYQFHFRLALAAAPTVLGVFSLALATALGRRRVWITGLVALTIGFGDYVLVYTSRDLYRPPVAAAAWVPNLLFGAAALLLHLRTRGRSAAGPSRLDDGPRSADQPVAPPA